MTKEQTAPEQRSVFFTKQPVLDAKRSIWGYELLGAEMKEGIYEVFPEQESAAGLCSSTYQGLQEAMRRGKKIMIGFDDAGILTGVPHALPASYGVVRVLPGAARMTGLVAALQELRREGYQIMLEAVPGESLSADICGQADIIGFDLSAGKPEQVLLDQVKASPALMLARGLKTTEQFQTTRDQGFSLFQGSFFKEPECVRDRKLGSNEVTRLSLFRLMEAEDPDIKALAAAIRTDVSVSFRLLSFLNSAAFGFRQNIQSIDQAIMLLGWLKLKSWLRAVLLVDMAGKDEVPQELAALSLQRGKFFELLATEYDYWGFNPSTLFLVGLFSLMDAILAMPMEEVVEMLPLDAKLKVALRRDPDSEYRPLFNLLDCLEDGDWPALETLAQQLCMDLGRIKEAFVAARSWTEGFFASST
jgi:EAL and modified HD-GYP domain-containing signal transduction protein